MATQHYFTKTDWWLPAVIGFILILGMAMLLWIGMEWYIVLILGIILLGYAGVSCFQISYAIKDNELGIHTQTKWMWYPIENIKEIRKVKSILAAPAMSFTRVQIKFERGTTRLAVPLEISPKDRYNFIQDILKINPNIKVIS